MKRLLVVALAAFALLVTSSADARLGDRARARRAARAEAAKKAEKKAEKPAAKKEAPKKGEEELPAPTAKAEQKAEKAAKRTPTFSFYKDKAGEWRWRAKAANGKVIADSGEGYKNFADCASALGLVRGSALIAYPAGKSPPPSPRAARRLLRRAA